MNILYIEWLNLRNEISDTIKIKTPFNFEKLRIKHIVRRCNRNLFHFAVVSELMEIWICFFTRDYRD